MAKKKAPEKSKKDDRKLFAFIATFLSIVGFIIVLAFKKDDQYVMFYAKQSLAVFVAYIISSIVGVLPFIGWVIGSLLMLITIILWIFSWVNALSGKMKETPVVGEYVRPINL